MLEAKREGISEEVREVAKKEGVSEKKLRELVAKGRTVVLGEGKRACGVGESLSTKINANVGTSEDYHSLKEELTKVRVAAKAGADAVMDLSMVKPHETLKAIVKASPIPVGTVPVYGAFACRGIDGISEDRMLNEIEKHIELGADFLTIHAAVLREGVELARKRTIKMVSRGGGFLASWMLHNEKENPLYTNFDYILELLAKNDTVISIGDALRPGCIADGGDGAQLHELKVQGELVKRAHAKNVQVICEGPGHMALDKIGENVRLQKKLCGGAPYYVLGPLVTDIAPGYDHITAAIGGTVAAAAGADFLCVVTPSEHLAFPTVEDVRDGVIATKIAAHAADIVKGRGEWKDLELSKARAKLDWEKQFEIAIDPERAKKYFKRKKSNSKACSMCGKYCAMRIMEEVL
ncbi:MAG: phosphomethylpyrimidine synthase ThiC [Candidatus Micrarchaeota archaeon]|nr:phosphomethylpyrimidine synthase ThiC [Candidatus Micrarchaeota archaeon]